MERQERLRPGDTEALSEPGLTLLTCTREAEAASRCVAAVLHRKKPIDCDIGILRYEVEGIYRVESTAAGRTTKDYK